MFKYVPTPALPEEDQRIKYGRQKFSLLLPSCRHKNVEDSLSGIESKIQHSGKWSHENNNLRRIFETHLYHQNVNRIEFGYILQNDMFKIFQHLSLSLLPLAHPDKMQLSVDC